MGVLPVLTKLKAAFIGASFTFSLVSIGTGPAIAQCLGPGVNFGGKNNGWTSVPCSSYGGGGGYSGGDDVDYSDAINSAIDVIQALPGAIDSVGRIMDAIPSFQIPQISSPTISFPNLSLPNVQFPSVSHPTGNVTLPNVQLPTFPNVFSPTIDATAVEAERRRQERAAAEQWRRQLAKQKLEAERQHRQLVAVNEDRLQRERNARLAKDGTKSGALIPKLTKTQCAARGGRLLTKTNTAGVGEDVGDCYVPPQLSTSAQAIAGRTASTASVSAAPENPFRMEAMERRHLDNSGRTEPSAPTNENNRCSDISGLSGSRIACPSPLPQNTTGASSPQQIKPQIPNPAIDAGFVDEFLKAKKQFETSERGKLAKSLKERLSKLKDAFDTFDKLYFQALEAESGRDQFKLKDRPGLIDDPIGRWIFDWNKQYSEVAADLEKFEFPSDILAFKTDMNAYPTFLSDWAKCDRKAIDALAYDITQSESALSELSEWESMLQRKSSEAKQLPEVWRRAQRFLEDATPLSAASEEIGSALFSASRKIQSNIIGGGGLERVVHATDRQMMKLQDLRSKILTARKSLYSVMNASCGAGTKSNIIGVQQRMP